MANQKQFSERRAKPERVWMLLDYLLGISKTKVGTPSEGPPNSTAPAANHGPEGRAGNQASKNTSSIKAKVFLGPDGRPMIVNGDLRQPVLVRSERFMDYLYYLYVHKLGRHDIPSASALRAVQRVIAGEALKAGSTKEEGVSTDPLLDVLLAVLETQFLMEDSFKLTLPALADRLNTKAQDAGYDTKDLPSVTSELSKQIKDRTEALQIRGIAVAFTRTNISRFVEFKNLNTKKEGREQNGSQGTPQGVQANGTPPSPPAQQAIEKEVHPANATPQAAGDRQAAEVVPPQPETSEPVVQHVIQEVLVA